MTLAMQQSRLYTSPKTGDDSDLSVKTNSDDTSRKCCRQILKDLHDVAEARNASLLSNGMEQNYQTTLKVFPPITSRSWHEA
jgi:hypothetical protein